MPSSRTALNFGAQKSLNDFEWKIEQSLSLNFLDWCG
jgi:hypothetical protein